MPGWYPILDRRWNRAGQAIPIGICIGYQLRWNRDHVNEIADLYEADVTDIIAFPANNLSDSDKLQEGSTILVPGGRIVAHPPSRPAPPTATHKPCLEYAVQQGDTFSAIVSRFVPDGADYEEFAARIIEINDLTNAASLNIGQVLQIPPASHQQCTEQSVAVPTPPSTVAMAVAVAVQATPVPAEETSSSFGFIWPAAGRMTSWFGPKHPLGIDIAMPTGTPVAASAAGQVTFVGGHACCSYGYYVIIKHDETFTTRYVQFSRFAVSLREWVEQGDLIGYSGATGDATEPHLHFEIRRNETPQNPLLYLP